MTDPIPVSQRHPTPPAPPAPVPEPVAWCRSDKFANAMQRGGSFHGWKYPGTGPNRCDMPLYAQAHPTQPAPVPVSVGHPPDSACDHAGRCWWFDPHNGGTWIYGSFHRTCSHWLPAGAMPRPGFEPITTTETP